MCNHNAGVASRLGMFHTAETWRMLVALYSTALSYEEAGRMASKAAAAKKAVASNGTNVDADSDTDADHDESENVLESRWVHVDTSWAGSGDTGFHLTVFNLIKTSYQFHFQASHPSRVDDRANEEGIGPRQGGLRRQRGCGRGCCKCGGGGGVDRQCGLFSSGRVARWRWRRGRRGGSVRCCHAQLARRCRG